MNYEETRAKWLSDNGFNENGVTYVYYPSNSYDVKEELKDNGFKFSKYLLWHCGDVPESYKDQVIEVKLEEVAEMMRWGEGVFYPEVELIVKKKVHDRAFEGYVSPYEHYDIEIGKRFRDLKVTLLSVKTIETRYGLKNVYMFEADEKYLFQWWTETCLPDECEVDSMFYIDGTVKDFSEYNGDKITKINRVKVKSLLN